MSQVKLTDDLLWQHLKTLPAFRALLRAVESRFYHAVELPEPLLDLGCGDGDFAKHTFNEYGRQLGTGLDPWWNPLKKSQVAGIYGRGVVQALGDHMPFPDKHFASAMSNSVLEHIPDIQPVLNETSRVLQTGGRFLITMPNHQYTECLGGAQLLEKWGLDRLAGRYRKGFNFIARHAHTEGIEWWAARLAEAGLAVERWQYYFSPTALHVLEIGHAQGLPSWITHALTGQWILAPTRENLALTERWVRPYYHEQAGPDGTMVMILARKAADHPIAAEIPAPQPFEVDPHGNLISDVPLPTLPTPVQQPVIPATQPPSSTPQHPDALPSPSRSLPTLSLPSLRQVGIGLMALLLSSLAYTLVRTPGQERPWLAVGTWVLGIVAAFVAIAPQVLQVESWPSRLTLKLPGNRRTWLVGSSLFVVALLIRTFALTSHPFILSGTEAALGNDAWRLISGFWKNPFGTITLSNPSLPLYPLGVSLIVFGKTVLGIRALSAVAGATTVLATYLIGRRLYSETIGLGAAVILLGMHTHIHYSRLGLTNIWDPLFMVVGVGLFALAWGRGRRLEWILAGFIWGFSAYLFTVSRFLPLVIGLSLGFLLFFDRSGWRKNGRYLLSAGFLALVIALPLVQHYRTVEGVFWERYNQYGVQPVNWIEQQALQTNRTTNAVWVDHLTQSLTAFNGAVDTSLYYNPERGLTGFAIGLLFAVGIILAAGYGGQLRYLLLIVWVGVTIYVAGILMIQSPASHRYLIATPAVALLAALPLSMLISQIRKILPAGEQRYFPLVHLVLVLGLATAAILPDLTFYFVEYRQNGRFADPNTEVGQLIGETLAPLPVGTTIYLFGAPRMFTDFPNITYLAGQFIPRQSIIDVGSPADLPENLQAERSVWIVLPENEGVLAELENRYPGGTLTAVDGRYATPLFYVYGFPD
ncbi:MAG: glycosyltransferase family 39 protein [Ardenticatenaceae bacterium]|nr:glycosyltransferase family 39 protein [Ardenticatenaceae bacterium]